MDLTWSDADAAFRAEVVAFLEAKLTPELRRAARRTTTVFVDKQVALAWQRILSDQGWLAYNWPVAYGGTGWTPAQRYIFEQECARADAPGLIPMSLKYVGPIIFLFGSEAQKARFLPRILSGEDYWCQGFSEPGAGSDLAALQCKAVRDGDHYIVNGTKIWTTHAHWANWIFCLARTSKGERRQDGISFLLIDMTSPGITVAPIVTMAGDHEVNQVFFDDVRVPAENLVGAEGKGWDYAKALLEYERGGGSFSGHLAALFDELKAILAAEADATAQPLLADPYFAERIVRIEAELVSLQMTEMRIFSSLSAGETPGPMSSILKVVASELEQKIDGLAVEALGVNALPFSGVRRDMLNALTEGRAHIVPRHLNARAATIFGGANEVQRDLIAKMIL